MSENPNVLPNVLWLSVSPYLKGFDQRLLSQLVKHSTVRRWDYCQTADEPCCTETVVAALHEYLTERAALEKSWKKGASHKVHLLGHGVSGIIGLLYARRYPEHVASLTLLSVGSLPAVNWQAHYYVLRQHLPCSRESLLAQMTRLLFGEQPRRLSKALSVLLARDLDNSLTLHSLAHHTHIAPNSLEVPLLVCNGEADAIIQSQKEPDWDQWRASEHSQVGRSARANESELFRIWQCPKGNHFFHFHHAEAVADQIASYWRQLSDASVNTIGAERSRHF